MAIEFDGILSLDDACLLHVASYLSPEHLQLLACTCKRFLGITRQDSLWVKHIADQWQLTVSICPKTGTGASGELSAVATPAELPAMQFFRRLRTANTAVQSLHVYAVATDGGCDEPVEHFWVCCPSFFGMVHCAAPTVLL
jgi:hypothetical protein